MHLQYIYVYVKILKTAPERKTKALATLAALAAGHRQHQPPRLIGLVFFRPQVWFLGYVFDSSIPAVN